MTFEVGDKVRIKPRKAGAGRTGVVEAVKGKKIAVRHSIENPWETSEDIECWAKRFEPAERYELIERTRKPRSDSNAGADVVRALGFLVDGGHSLPEIAIAVEVTLRTVRRWSRGQSRPRAANFEALRSVVSNRYTRLLARHDIRAPRVAHEVELFEKITGALMTDAERAADRELVERMTASLEAAQATETTSSYRSVTRDVDPFELIARSSKPEPHIPF